MGETLAQKIIRAHLLHCVQQRRRAHTISKIAVLLKNRALAGKLRLEFVHFSSLLLHNKIAQTAKFGTPRDGGFA